MSGIGTLSVLPGFSGRLVSASIDRFRTHSGHSTADVGVQPNAKTNHPIPIKKWIWTGRNPVGVTTIFHGAGEQIEINF